MKKRRLKKKYRILLNKLEILLFLLLIFLVFKSLLTKEATTKKQNLKISTDTIYLTIDETYTLTPKVKVVYNVTNPEIISIKNNTVTALKDGNTKIEVTYKEEKEVIDVVVTNLYTLPKINNKKPYLTCNLYTAEEESILDSSLKFKINSSGYKTRAGVVTSARFLTLQFKNSISYFYENGRLVNYGDQDYADGEGRYYHEGLYLTESEKAKLYNIKFYFALLRNEEEKVGDEFYKLDRSLRKQIINPHNFESLKTALLIASIIDSSYDLYEYLTLQIDKDKNKYYASRVNIEENLIDKSLSFIETKKIEWFKKEN